MHADSDISKTSIFLHMKNYADKDQCIKKQHSTSAHTSPKFIKNSPQEKLEGQLVELRQHVQDLKAQAEAAQQEVLDVKAHASGNQAGFQVYPIKGDSPCMLCSTRVIGWHGDLVY